MFKAEKSTFIGLIIGVSFILASMLVSGHAELFWNLPSVFIIFGGSLAAVIVAFPPKRLKTLFPVLRRAFIKDRYDSREDIITLVSLAEKARREGLLALEDVINDYEDNPFLKKGIQLIVDGTDVEQLRNSLEGATYFMKQRHKKGAEMVNMIATTAPALGLLGTYVGLIPMLSNLDDPTTLGPMMALELVSSFYGAFIAYVIFAPLAKRLKNMSQEEETNRELLIEGLVAISVGKNPRQLKDELAAYANIDIDTLEDSEYRNKFKAQELGNKL